MYDTSASEEPIVKTDDAWETVSNGVQRSTHILVATLVISSGANAEPSSTPSAFVEPRVGWMHPVTGFSGVGEGLSTGAYVGFYPSPSAPVAITAGFGVSCAQHLNCWENGLIGVRYAHASSSRIAILVDGLGGLETVGLHVGKELYGYVATASIAVVYRDGSLDVGPQLGMTYSKVASYDPDVGPNPSGAMTSLGVVAGYRW